MTRFIKKRRWAAKTLLLFFGITFIAPVLVTLALSFSFERRFPVLGQYGELLITNNAFLRFFWNSVFYSLCIMLACIIIAFPLGFVFAKVKFPGGNALFFVYIIAMMLPFQATLLPNYIQLRDFRMLNTPLALILPLALSPFAVFLLRQFIKGIPAELLDCATLDTSSATKILWHVVLPQVRAATGALAVMVFCESWNMVEPALIFAAKNPDIHPLSVRLGDLPPQVSFSAAVVYMAPILFLFLMFKESLAASMEHFRWGK